METKFIITSDKEGQVTATVEIEGKDYEVELNTVQMPTAKRNELIREMAQEQAKART